MARLLPALLVIAAIAGACGDSSESPAAPTGAGTDQVVEIEVTSADHVLGEVDYPSSPPAGGDHFGAWQNCGFYTVTLRDEVVVHSLEHGAVWVTYRAGIDSPMLEAIGAATASESYLLASPYENQESPLVLTAWGRQVEVDTWTDPAVAEFLDDYLGRRSLTAPEPGASCADAIGDPPDDPLARYDEAVAALSGS